MNYRLNISNKEGNVVIELLLEKDKLPVVFLVDLWKDVNDGAPYVIVKDIFKHYHSIPRNIFESCICSIFED